MPALDSGFHDVDSGSRVLDSRFHLSGFRIPKGLIFRIPDSKTWILDSKVQDFVFHKQKCSRFRIPRANVSWIPDSKVQDFVFHKQKCSRFRIPRANISWIPESRFSDIERFVQFTVAHFATTRCFLIYEEISLILVE